MYVLTIKTLDDCLLFYGRFDHEIICYRVANQLHKIYKEERNLAIEIFIDKE